MKKLLGFIVLVLLISNNVETAILEEKSVELNKVKKVSSSDRFRLSISRSSKNISAQIIDDSKSITLISASSVEKDVKSGSKVNKSELSKILKNLVSQGLLEQVNSDRANKYKISVSGSEFLQAYKTFSKFTDDFGLTI